MFVRSAIAQVSSVLWHLGWRRKWRVTAESPRIDWSHIFQFVQQLLRLCGLRFPSPSPRAVPPVIHDGQDHHDQLPPPPQIRLPDLNGRYTLPARAPADSLQRRALDLPVPPHSTNLPGFVLFLALENDVVGAIDACDDVHELLRLIYQAVYSSSSSRSRALKGRRTSFRYIIRVCMAKLQSQGRSSTGFSPCCESFIPRGRERCERRAKLLHLPNRHSHRCHLPHLPSPAFPSNPAKQFS